MRLMSIIFLILTTSLASQVFSQTNTNQIDGSAFYRLTNDFAGSAKALSISGANGAVVMAATSNSYDQLWKFASLGNGKYRIINAGAGDGKSLDNRKSGDQYSVVMGATGNYSGQFWTLTPQGSGKYRLSNDYAGTGNSMDSANMAATGNFSGQYWTLTKVTPPTVAPVKPTSAPTSSGVVTTNPVPNIANPVKVVIGPTTISGVAIDPTANTKPAVSPSNTNPPLTYNNVIIPWDPTNIPKGGTMVCSADLKASSNCGLTKADWVGKHTINLKCEKGFYDPILGGTCWDFPKDDGNGTWVRGTTAITADDAVWRAPKETLKPAVKVKTTGLAWECDAGTFWDGWSGAGSGGAGCYKCPDSNPRRTANPVYSQQACASVANETAKAVFLGYNGCQKPDAATMGLKGKRMPGKPFLDVGGGGCYACPTADEGGNILVTERNGNSVTGDGGCTIKFIWRSPEFPEPGMARLIGVKEILLENLIFQNPDILTLYLTQVARDRGLQPGTPESRRFVEEQWQQIADHPYQSPHLSNLVFAFLEVALKTAPERRSAAETKLISAMQEYVTARRLFIAEQALAMYDAWKKYDDNTHSERLQNRIMVMGIDFGTVPLDFQAAAVAGFGLGAEGLALAGTIAGADIHATKLAEVTREQIAKARAANLNPKDFVEAVKMAAREETLFQGLSGLKEFRAMSMIGQLTTAGPAVLIELAGIIMQSIAIDQYIAIQEARPRLLIAVQGAKQTADLNAILDGPDGRDQLTYFWSKAMDVKATQEDPELVAKARVTLDLARQRGFMISPAQ